MTCPSKWYVHVNQHKIRKNIHSEEIDPPIAIRRGKVVKYATRVSLPPDSVIVYEPHRPILSCGARLVIECPTEPEVLE